MDDEPDEHVFAQCYGKEPFKNGGIAKSVAKRRSQRGLKGEAYRCPHCDQWHIGRRAKWRRPR